MAGRIGSTRPMPMKDTTQANATAKTAFGCRNGLATEPWVPGIDALFLVATRAFWWLHELSGGYRSWPVRPGAPGPRGWAAGGGPGQRGVAGERRDGSRPAHSLLRGRGHPGRDPAEPLRPHR